MKKILKLFSSIISLFTFLTYNHAIADYKVGPGDILEITVWEEEDLSGIFKISPKGTISHPLLNDFYVSGKSVSQITYEFTEALKKDYLVNPKVNIIIKEYHSQKVYLFGMIQKPGIYELKEDNSLLKLLLGAGGPTPEASDIIKIMRVGNSLDSNEQSEDAENNEKSLENVELKGITVDIKKLFSEGDLSQNISLNNGDLIFVPSREEIDLEKNRCYVLGEVKKPGSFKVTKGYTILTAIIDAGGFTDYASPNNTKLIRGTGKSKKVMKLKLKDLMEKGDKKGNILLEPDDLIIVPGGFF